MGRPRAADDFPAIRARLEELRRERSGDPAPDNRRTPDRPQTYAVGNGSAQSRSSRRLPIMPQTPQRVRTT